MHSQIIKTLEQNMVNVTSSMEQRGLNVDLVELERLISKTSKQKENIDQSLRNTLGLSGPVNFNSSKDVSEILSSKLGIKPTHTKSGRLSTSRYILRSLSNPLTDDIINYRNLETLLSSLKAIHLATDKVSGKIFCSYVDTCPSGRLYTKNYSFQSIPEAARDVIYADSNCSFVLADYDTFELRILSALSKDKYFKECWARGLDLHRKVVSDMQGISYESVTDQQRKLGKALNFGQSYGQEAIGLSRKLHTSTKEAQQLIDDYKRNIPEIEQYKRSQIKNAGLTGYSDTFYGRRRFLSDINSQNTSSRKKAERRVTNHIIQGTGADIVKFAMVSLHKAGFIMNTMLHDGILFTVRDNVLDQSVKRIREIMEIEINDMKFPVTIKTGKTWRECY